MKKDMSDKEIEFAILEVLDRRGHYGERYVPTTKIRKAVEGKINRNGKSVKNAMIRLAKKDWLRTKKRGNVISINPGRREDMKKLKKKMW